MWLVVQMSCSCSSSAAQSWQWLSKSATWQPPFIPPHQNLILLINPVFVFDLNKLELKEGTSMMPAAASMHLHLQLFQSTIATKNNQTSTKNVCYKKRVEIKNWLGLILSYPALYSLLAESPPTRLPANCHMQPEISFLDLS